MAKALTAQSVERLRPDPSRRLEIADALLPGLYFVVQPSGARSWAVRYRYGGKPRKLTLGTYPVLELGTARDRAREAFRALASVAIPPLKSKRRSGPPRAAFPTATPSLPSSRRSSPSRSAKAAGKHRRTRRAHSRPSHVVPKGESAAFRRSRAGTLLPSSTTSWTAASRSPRTASSLLPGGCSTGRLIDLSSRTRPALVLLRPTGRRAAIEC